MKHLNNIKNIQHFIDYCESRGEEPKSGHVEKLKLRIKWLELQVKLDELKFKII